MNLSGSGKDSSGAWDSNCVHLSALRARRILWTRQFLQLLERRGVLCAHLVRTGASRVGVLECPEDRLRQRNRITAMARLADKIPLGLRLDVASEAVAPEAVDDFGEATLVDRCAFLGYVELKEFPIVCHFVEALRLLYHDLGRHQLNNGATESGYTPPWGDLATCSVPARFPIRLPTKTAYRFQVTDATEGLVGHRN